MKFLKTKTKTLPIVYPYKILGNGEAPIFKTSQELEQLVIPPIFKTHAFTINKKGINLLEHRERLHKATDKSNLWFTDKQANELQKAGFQWFVLSNFICQFHYHASLDNHSVNQRLKEGGFSYGKVSFSGDIPDFALDSIEHAKKTRLNLFRNIYDKTRWDGIEHLTVHSMQPMPVELRIFDPVVIGWRFDPSIWLNENGTLSSYYKDTMGVIITAWDIEGELR